MKILIAITTFNEIDITEACIKSIIKSDNYSNIYPIIIDDNSNKENLKILSKKYNIPIIGKIIQTGLTHSWNMAYKYFMDNLSNYIKQWVTYDDYIKETNKKLKMIKEKRDSLETDITNIMKQNKLTNTKFNIGNNNIINITTSRT